MYRKKNIFENCHNYLRRSSIYAVNIQLLYQTESSGTELSNQCAARFLQKGREPFQNLAIFRHFTKISLEN